MGITHGCGDTECEASRRADQNTEHTTRNNRSAAKRGEYRCKKVSGHRNGKQTGSNLSEERSGAERLMPTCEIRNIIPTIPTRAGGAMKSRTAIHRRSRGAVRCDGDREVKVGESLGNT